MDRKKLMDETFRELLGGKNLEGQRRLDFIAYFRSLTHDVINACPDQASLTAKDVVWRLGEVLRADPREVASGFYDSV